MTVSCQPSLREVIGRRAADDAAADDHRVRILLRERCGVRRLRITFVARFDYPPTHVYTSRASTACGRTSKRAMLSFTQARAVVIGGGIVGCSTAYHLAKLGWQDTVIVERHKLTSDRRTTRRGLVGQLRTSANITQMLGLRLRSTTRSRQRPVSRAAGR